MDTGTDTGSGNSDEGLLGLRGRTGLARHELQAHFAALLDLPNIAVLLGAGASLCAGGHHMGQIKQSVDAERLQDAALETAYQRLLNDGFTADLCALETRWTELKLLLEAARVGRFVACKDEVEHVLLAFERALMRAARLDAVDPSESQATQPAKTLAHHRALLRKLVYSRQPGQPAPWVFTTNYDLAVEWAAEDESVALVTGFEGLHQRRFSPRSYELGWYNTQARGEARFGNSYLYLAKIHGSLSWTLERGAVVEEPWGLARSRVDAFVSKTSAKHGSVLIPPSAAKYVDTVGFVHGEMFRRFAEFCARPNATVLVNGYSFSDPHIDRILLSALSNPTFHLVVCVFGTAPQATPGALREAVLAADLNDRLRRLVEQDHPAVTVVVGDANTGAAAFDRFVGVLPDPALLDERSREMRRRLGDLLRAMSGEGAA